MADTKRPEGFEACVARVAKAGEMSGTAARQILAMVHDRAEEMRLSGTPDPFMAAASEIAAKTVENARLDRLDAVRNAAKRAAIMTKITGFGDAEQVLRDMLHGSNVGSRENVQSEWLGRAAPTNAAIDNQLKKAGVSNAAVTGQLDRETARALWAKNAGTEAEASGPAKAIAEAYHPAMEEMRRLQNEHGARIGDAPDFAFHTWHDPLLMRRGGRGASGSIAEEAAFEQWRALTEPKLAEKTFDGVEDRARFMRSVFNALVTGIHMTASGFDGMPIDEAGKYVPPAFEGTHNIAKKVSQPRVLFWKDADAWYEYNQKYGRYRTLYEGMQSAVNQGSRNIALMDKFGTNPAANLNQVIRAVQEKFRDTDLDGANQFAKKIPGVQNVMARLDGSANIPIQSMWLSLGEGARDYYNAVSLGGVGVTHFASIWMTVPAELRHHGVGVGTDALGLGNITGALGNIGRTAAMLVRGKGPMERQAITSDLGAYAGGFTYNLARNWNALFERGNTPMGRITALHTLFMKATGIHYLFDTARAGLREFLSHNLARQFEHEFTALDPHLQQMLGKYGIHDEEWNQLRSIKDLRTWEGRTYITPKDALGTEGGQALADKLLMYFHDSADHGVVVPGVKERAFLYGAMRPGDPRYEAMRLFTQFKIWPVAAMNQLLGREIHMALSKGDAAWGIGLTIALSAMAGYTRMAITDMAYGNKLRDPRDPAVLLAGLTQGGGLGIAGDLLFGEVNRLGASGLVTLLGPEASDADQLLRIYGRYWTAQRTGKTYDPWPDIAQFARHHVPFANLVYLKGSLDYLLWYHLMEAAKPGFWERTNRRMQVEQGRTLAGYVPGAGVPYGVPGVYMKNQAGQSFGLLGGGAPH